MFSLSVYFVSMYGGLVNNGQELGYLAFSFLCTFVPGSEKSTERTFAPVELSFRGTFAPGERNVQELLFHKTFAPLELSLLRSKCSKNFRSMELSHPLNVRSTNNFRAL